MDIFEPFFGVVLVGTMVLELIVMVILCCIKIRDNDCFIPNGMVIFRTS